MKSIKKKIDDSCDANVAIEIGKLAEENFGEEVKVVDIKKLSCVADYLVLVTGTSSTHINSLCNKIDKFARTKRERLGMEGRAADTEWVLLDYGTIIVHIFDPTARIFYNLDELWNGEIMTWSNIQEGTKHG